MLGRGDAVSRINETNHNRVALQRRPDDQLPLLSAIHGAMTVLGEIQERLEQRLALGSDRRHRLRDVPDIEYRTLGMTAL